MHARGDGAPARVVPWYMTLPQYHRAVRRTAWFALVALLLALVAGIVFETGQTPIAYAAGLLAPTVAMAAAPLLYVALALRAGPHRRALAIGVAYPAAVLVGIWLALSGKYASGTEGAMGVAFMFMFFFVNKAWTVLLLLFFPALVRLLIVSWKAYRSLPDARYPHLAKWAAAMTVLLIAASAPLAGDASAGVMTGQRSEYRIDVVDNALLPMYECLWRVAGPGAERGFPAALDSIRTVEYRPLQNSGNRFSNRCEETADAVAGYPFTVAYAPRAHDASGVARGFTLRLVEKTREGGRARIVTIDETGIRRDGRSPADSASDTMRIVSTRALTNLLILERLIDEYAASHDGQYPARIVNESRYPSGATAPPATMAAPVGECSGDADTLHSSCITRSERAIIYAPLVAPGGERRRFILSMQPLSYYDNVQQQPIPSRTVYRDADGSLHAFGGWRPATADDPDIPLDELAIARADVQRFFGKRADDSLRAERYRRQQDSIWGRKADP